MKTTIAVCVTLIAVGLAASQLPYLLAQDAPPGDGAAAPAAPPVLELPPVSTTGMPRDAAVPRPSRVPTPPLPGQTPTGQPAMLPPQTAIDTGQGPPAVSGFGVATVPEGWRQGDRRVLATGGAMVPSPPPADPRVREMTEKYNQLEQDVLRLAAEFRRMAADAPDRESTVKKITEITQQQFQLRHDARQLEIERLQKQLEDLQDKLRKREEKRDQIVQQRVEQLTDQKDELRWEPLEPAGVARYVPYGDVYRGLATPPSGMYSPQPLLTPPALPQFPQPARDGQAPIMPRTFPSLPANPDPLAGKASVPAAVPFPPQTEGTPALSEGLSPLNGMGQSLLEAKVRLEAAEQEFRTIKAQFDAGMIQSREMQRAEAERKLAEAALVTARQQHGLRAKMLELDVRRTQAALEAAKAELDAQAEILRRST